MRIINAIIGLLNLVFVSSLFLVLRTLCSEAEWPITSFTEFAFYATPLVDVICVCFAVWFVCRKRYEDAGNLLNFVAIFLQAMLLLCVATQIGLYVLKLK
jgi:hypothetical protein